MKTTPASAPVVRRLQSERTASTRAKVIDAAIVCLHRLGYSLTTTTLVAEEAGVSRGAMIHHFPTKTDLMLAVVQDVFERDAEHYKQSVLNVSPLEWMRRVSSTVWEVVSRPAGVAVMEIMLASRSDLELAAKLRTIQTQIDSEAHEWIVERHVAAGVRERPDGEAIHRLVVAAARGLALEELFMHNGADVKKSIDLLSEAMQYFYPELSTPGAADAEG